MWYVIAAIIAFVIGSRIIGDRDDANQEFLDEQHGRGHELRDTSWPSVQTPPQG